MADKKASSGTGNGEEPPKNQVKPEKTAVAFTLDNHLLERLDAFARERGFSRTAIIKMAIQNLLKSGARIESETPDCDQELAPGRNARRR